MPILNTTNKQYNYRILSSVRSVGSRSRNTVVLMVKPINLAKSKEPTVLALVITVAAV